MLVFSKLTNTLFDSKRFDAVFGLVKLFGEIVGISDCYVTAPDVHMSSDHDISVCLQGNFIKEF